LKDAGNVDDNDSRIVPGVEPFAAITSTVIDSDVPLPFCSGRVTEVRD
jgi:hypothetical protein